MSLSANISSSLSVIGRVHPCRVARRIEGEAHGESGALAWFAAHVDLSTQRGCHEVVDDVQAKAAAAAAAPRGKEWIIDARQQGRRYALAIVGVDQFDHPVLGALDVDGDVAGFAL